MSQANHSARHVVEARHNAYLLPRDVLGSEAEKSRARKSLDRDWEVLKAIVAMFSSAFITR